MKRFLAIANLGIHFALHCARQAWYLCAGRPDGLARFLEHYRADGIRAVTAAEESAQAEVARCLTCGACSFPLAQAGRVPPNLDLAPCALASTLTRAYTFFPAAAEVAQAYGGVRPADYRCPVGVDLARARSLIAPAPPSPENTSPPSAAAV